MLYVVFALVVYHHHTNALMTVWLLVCSDDWRADGYRWKQNGYSDIPRKEKVYRKIHFKIRTCDNELSSAFQKYVYKRCEGDYSHVIVHYIGDENTAVDFPHGIWMSFCSVVIIVVIIIIVIVTHTDIKIAVNFAGMPIYMTRKEHPVSYAFH